MEQFGLDRRTEFSIKVLYLTLETKSIFAFSCQYNLEILGLLKGGFLHRRFLS